MHWFLYSLLIIIFVLIKFRLSTFSYIKSSNVTEAHLSIFYWLITISIFYFPSIQEDISTVIKYVIVLLENSVSDLNKVIPKESLMVLGPIIGVSSISCLTGIPLWLLNKTNKNYESIRYTTFTISESCEMAKWIENFITSQSKELNNLTRFDVTLCKNLDFQRKKRTRYRM